MDFYVYKIIDYCFEAAVYVNEIYTSYINPPQERVLESSYDLETDTITLDYKIEDNIFTFNFPRTLQRDVNELINEFKNTESGDKILDASIVIEGNENDITKRINELCGPSGCHLEITPMRLSYISPNINELKIMDDMCTEHTFTSNDVMMNLD